MTEEIIIDCGWYRNGWCGCETEDKKCEQIKLCKFKDDKLKQQLKRLEQENKELKELNKKICEDWEKEIKVYWNVLEEIREIANAIISGKHISNNIIDEVIPL